MAGVKYSKQREAILAYLHSTKEHPTAEKVYSELRQEFPKLSLGTVYRNLNLLAESGEIMRLNCGDNTDHFDATVTQHYHFICRKCEKIFDLEMPSLTELNESVTQSFGGEVEGHRVYFYGRCRDCIST